WVRWRRNTARDPDTARRCRPHRRRATTSNRSALTGNQRRPAALGPLLPRPPRSSLPSVSGWTERTKNTPPIRRIDDSLVREIRRRENADRLKRRPAVASDRRSCQHQPRQPTDYHRGGSQSGFSPPSLATLSRSSAWYCTRGTDSTTTEGYPYSSFRPSGS